VVAWLLESSDSRSGNFESNNIGSEHDWEVSYSKLCNFKELFGHCLVYTGAPDFTNRALAHWVHRQRAARGCQLSADQEARLCSLGFEFDAYVAEW